MKEHNKNFYSIEELKRARDCYEGYQDGEEVFYFVGALRYACDEIERLNKELNTYKYRPKTRFRDVIELRDKINKAIEYIEQHNDYFLLKREVKNVLDILKGVDKQ